MEATGNLQAMDGDFWGIAKIGAGTGIGAILMFLVTYFAGRSDASQHGAFKLIAALEARLELVTARLDRTEAALADCTQRHIESDRKIAELEAATLVPGMARQQAQQIIAANAKQEREG